MLTNVLANALAHTPEGSPVEVRLGQVEDGDGGAAVVEVIDHGPGIPESERRRVFERFVRFDPSRSRGTGGGSGLGLSIVAAIVAAHRGRVGIGETPGGGATFIVRIPTGISQPAPMGR